MKHPFQVHTIIFMYILYETLDDALCAKFHSIKIKAKTEMVLIS